MNTVHKTDSYSGFNSQLLWLLERRQFWRSRCETICRWWIRLQTVIWWHSLCWLIINPDGLLTLAAYNKSARARLGRRLGQCFGQCISRQSQRRCFGGGEQSGLGAGSCQIRHRIHNCGSRKSGLHRNPDCLWAFRWTARLISQFQAQLYSSLEFCWQLNMHNTG